MPSFSWCIEFKVSSNVYAREEFRVSGWSTEDFPGRVVNIATCFAAACQGVRGTLGQGRLLVCVSYIRRPEYMASFLTHHFNDLVVK